MGELRFAVRASASASFDVLPVSRLIDRGASLREVEPLKFPEKS
jgi:hypothetical protein